MSSNRVSIDRLAGAIMEELENYSEDVTEQIKKDVVQVAKQCRDEIRSTAPRKDGDYAESWETKKVFESDHDIRMVVHNKKEYRLAHLLEHGHAIVRGGRKIGEVGSIAHIKPAELNAEKELLGRVKVAVR